jgi:elongator complex protein 4
MFPSHHGFVHIHSLPSPSSLLSLSDKFSTLRGLTSSGENNLAFKCMRKRLVFETLHLDVEGGVGERRTTPANTAIALDETAHQHSYSDSAATATIEVRVEEVTQKVKAVSMAEKVTDEATPVILESAMKKPKPRKKVAFMSDRPDLYDF